jgi:hypothetical protein
MAEEDRERAEEYAASTSRQWRSAKPRAEAEGEAGAGVATDAVTDDTDAVTRVEVEAEAGEGRWMERAVLWGCMCMEASTGGECMAERAAGRGVRMEA